MNPAVVSIHIARDPGGELLPLEAAEVVAGKGIAGDRKYREDGSTPGAALTLVEAEQVDAFNAATGFSIEAHDTRRNVVTRGVDLNALVGRRFRLGELELRGTELCEPCRYLAGKLIERYGATAPPSEIVAGLVHRAGIRAEVLRGGTLRPGDGFEPLEPAAGDK